MGSLVQFVCFSTVLAQEPFLQAWEPFGSGFLARGIDRIVLSENTERSSEAAFDYVSRNLWDEKRFERAFPHGVRGSGGLGPISVLQAGGFRLAESANVDPSSGPRQDTKVLAFFMARTGHREKTRAALRSVMQHPGVNGGAIYIKDGDARTDRFDMVSEVYCHEAEAGEVINLLRVAVTPHVTAAPVIVGAYLEVAEMGVEAKRV